MPAVMTFCANFLRRHANESMSRLLALLWFLAAAGYATFKAAPDATIFGLMSANCLTCLGLRSKATAPESSSNAS